MYTPTNGQRSIRYVDALREATMQEMERDSNVFLYGLDVDDHKGIQGSTLGLQERFGPERVFGTPLSEDAMTGVAIGAAMAGMRPIHVHIRMDFVLLCMNQLINMAAKAHYMYGGQVKVPLVIRCMIGKSWGQGAQHSQALHSMFMHVPGLKVVMPSNAHDAKGCMIAAIRDDNPVIFIEHRLLYSTECYVPEAPYTVELGRARVCARGTDITLVGLSNMVMECLRARDLLMEVGINAEVIDPISVAPLDMDTIIESVNRTGRLLVVDCAWTSCGASAEILARLAESPDCPGPVQMQRIGFAFSPCPPSPPLEQAFYPDPSKIAAKVHAMLRPHEGAWAPDPEKTVLTHELQFRGPF
jgi:pyruvate dehydrogenase E1 component beta subunit